LQRSGCIFNRRWSTEKIESFQTNNKLTESRLMAGTKEVTLLRGQPLPSPVSLIPADIVPSDLFWVTDPPRGIRITNQTSLTGATNSETDQVSAQLVSRNLGRGTTFEEEVALAWEMNEIRPTEDNKPRAVPTTGKHNDESVTFDITQNGTVYLSVGRYYGSAWSPLSGSHVELRTEAVMVVPHDLQHELWSFWVRSVSGIDSALSPQNLFAVGYSMPYVPTVGRRFGGARSDGTLADVKMVSTDDAVLVSTPADSAPAPVKLSDGQWHHVVAWRKAGSSVVDILYDGELHQHITLSVSPLHVPLNEEGEMPTLCLRLFGSASNMMFDQIVYRRRVENPPSMIPFARKNLDKINTYQFTILDTPRPELPVSKYVLKTMEEVREWRSLPLEGLSVPNDFRLSLLPREGWQELFELDKNTGSLRFTTKYTKPDTARNETYTVRYSIEGGSHSHTYIISLPVVIQVNVRELEGKVKNYQSDAVVYGSCAAAVVVVGAISAAIVLTKKTV